MENENHTVPYIIYEGEMARNERHIKRLIIAIIVAIALIFVSNAAWLWAWCQYDYSSETVSIDGGDGGNANYIGNDGDIYNGEDTSVKTDAHAEGGRQQSAQEET